MDQFIVRLNSATANLTESLDDWLYTRAAKESIAQVTNRVELKGEKAEGGQFTAYSTKKLPLFFFTSKSTTKTATKEINSKNYPDGISYEEFRDINGRQTAFKDFSFTRQMWKSFQVKEKRVTKTTVDVTARMGDQNRGKITNQEIMEAHSEREKSELVAMSNKEIDNLTNRMEIWVENYFKNAFSG